MQHGARAGVASAGGKALAATRVTYSAAKSLASGLRQASNLADRYRSMLIEYENPVRLTGDVTARRIFSPLAYALVRHANVVPVVLPEAWSLAAWFPVVWHRTGQTYDLVAVRSLMPAGRGYLPAVERLPGLLPLILQAYPFLPDPSLYPAAGAARLIDDVIADAPTDIGAPILVADKRPTKATRLRLGMLDLFARHWSNTRSLGSDLAALDLFEPWDLNFDINGRNVGISELYIVRQHAFGPGALAPVVARHGSMAAQLLALHRISLFRAGSLLGAARIANGAHAQSEQGNDTTIRSGGSA